MEAMEPPLLTQTRGQVAVLTLNRPGRLNAIGRGLRPGGLRLQIWKACWEQPRRSLDLS